MRIRTQLLLLCLSLCTTWLAEAERGSSGLAPTHGFEKVAANSKAKPKRYPYLTIRDFKNQRLRAVSAHGRDDDENSTDTTKHSGFSVALRALYLLVIFSPAIISAPLAYVLPLFRNYVWFKLLVNIIGNPLLLLLLLPLVLVLVLVLFLRPFCLPTSSNLIHHCFSDGRIIWGGVHQMGTVVKHTSRHVSRGALHCFIFPACSCSNSFLFLHKTTSQIGIR